VKHARWEQMNELLKQISRANNQKELWMIRRILVNEMLPDGRLVGYTDNMKQIVVASSLHHPQVWAMLPVRITGAGEFKLEWEIQV
jgi:tRNA A37 methylthiotransferase MiaB